MVSYGCNVANKFGFMSDDDEFEDPQELIAKAAQVEAERAAAQKKADKVAATTKAAPPTKDVSKPAGKENRPSGNDRGRGGRGRGRGGPRTPREGGDVSDRFGESGGRGRGGPRGRGARPFRGRGGNVNTSSDENKEVSFEGENQEVHAEGGRGYRGGRGNYGDRRGGRGAGRGRQFDRQSGSDRTGVRGSDKKDGHGKGNWGDVKDEITGETEVTEEKPEEPVVPREKTAEELAYEAEMAEFAKMKTLKEFKAAQKKDAPGFKVRQAGEGAQENFGKLVPLQKELIEDKEDEIIIVRKESSKKILNIDIQFADAGAGRGNRGAPRGGRGRGGRGGSRGGSRQSGPAPFDASAEAFPALGAQ